MGYLTPCVCTGLFAGSPAPTDTAQALGLRWTCGSGQAREEASTGNTKTRFFYCPSPAVSSCL
ncbi:hypothetical protein CX682_11425 [Pseudomonas sp. FFUP_PS_41]|nr:hypothetical protein CX682_11425 [Pseudomonas sp. FFUP_PS_41]